MRVEVDEFVLVAGVGLNVHVIRMVFAVQLLSASLMASCCGVGV